MEIEKTISSRRAVRAFRPEPVEENTIRSLIGAAIEAPSAMNEQPWSFVVVRSQTLLDRISQNCKEYMTHCLPAGLLPPHLRTSLADPGFHIFYHAPVLIVICSRVDGPWATIDCTLAAENLMLAARSCGLGTCWIGFAQNWLGTEAGKQALKLPAAWLPVAPIIVGHPVEFPPAVARKPPEITRIDQ